MPWSPTVRPHKVPLVLMEGMRAMSDISLTCQGEKFRVHKAFITRESTILDDIIKKKFSETNEGVIDVPCDVKSVKRMLHYMYIGDYDLRIDLALRNLFESFNKDADQVPRIFKKIAPWDQRPKGIEAFELDQDVYVPNHWRSIEEKLGCHLRANCVAARYRIEPLVSLSIKECQKILEERWDASIFIDFLEYSSRRNCSRNFFEMLVACGLHHASELYNMGCFNPGGSLEKYGSWFFCAFLKSKNSKSSKF
ncbi:hypothetical protein F5Y16DRAFT_399525 [Xylariaceae sp. FL0255]|nr:hypothetical protein F5Y16DRAFT_399525 [Xylariaceae sp. FL0255]